MWYIYSIITVQQLIIFNFVRLFSFDKSLIFILMVDNIFPSVVGNKQTQGIYCSPRSLFFISLKIKALINRTTLSLVNTTLQKVDSNISILKLLLLRYKICNFFSTIRQFLFAKNTTSNASPKMIVCLIFHRLTHVGE